MNEKLTPEQIADDVAFIIQREMPDDVHSVDVAEIISAVQHYIIQQLTANTAEDERHDCIKHLRQLGWNVTEPAEYDGLTGKYLKGDLSKANPVAIKPKPEDEPKPTYCTCGQTVCTCNPTVNWLQQEDK